MIELGCSVPRVVIYILWFFLSVFTLTALLVIVSILCGGGSPYD
jgi:hypothetical protein